LKNSTLCNIPIWVDAIISIWCIYFYFLLSVIKAWFKPLTSNILNSIKNLVLTVIIPGLYRDRKIFHQHAPYY
jgi:uncharacterized membrane protein